MSFGLYWTRPPAAPPPPEELLGPAVTVLIIVGWITALWWITKNDQN